MIRICIIEDLEEISKGLEEIIASNTRFQHLMTFTNGEDAIRKIPSLAPHIVISDINLPGISGITCVQEIRKKNNAIQFMMFTIHDENDQVFEALKAGANSYILKNASEEKIITAIDELYEGGSPMSPSIARKIMNSFQTNVLSNEAEKLTSRELEILQLISKGLLYKEIAEKLFLSESTVKKHLNNTYQKLHVNNKTEAINKVFYK